LVVKRPIGWLRQTSCLAIDTLRPRLSGEFFPFLCIGALAAMRRMPSAKKEDVKFPGIIWEINDLREFKPAACRRSPFPKLSKNNAPKRPHESNIPRLHGSATNKRHGKAHAEP
jgi:hypothetical protein